MGGSKNISKDRWLLPNLPSGIQGIVLLLQTQSLSKAPPLWDMWPLLSLFFFNGASLTFENYQLLSLLNDIPFSLKLFKYNLESLLKWMRTIYYLLSHSGPALFNMVFTSHVWLLSTWNTDGQDETKSMVRIRYTPDAENLLRSSRI